jgi:hypothetical protein
MTSHDPRNTFRGRANLGWKRGTRAFVIGVTVTTVLIVAIVRHQSGNGSTPNLTPTPCSSVTAALCTPTPPRP